MRYSNTEKLQAEYADTFNNYMSLPDGSKELKELRKKLDQLNEILARQFLLESGYDLEKTDNGLCKFIKDGQ